MIHKTAIIQKGAKVHPEASIGPYCTIGKNVEIGRALMQGLQAEGVCRVVGLFRHVDHVP